METRKSMWLAIIGLIASVPAFIIVAIGMLNVVWLNDIAETFNRYLTPQSLILHPAIVLGGLLISIGMNFIPVFNVKFEPQNGMLVTTITTKLRLVNIAALTLSAFFLCALLLYAFGENFKIVTR